MREKLPNLFACLLVSYFFVPTGFSVQQKFATLTKTRYRGNVGDIGRLIITNLRIMWYSLQNSKLTLCKYANFPIMSGGEKTLIKPKDLSKRKRKWAYVMISCHIIKAERRKPNENDNNSIFSSIEWVDPMSHVSFIEFTPTSHSHPLLLRLGSCHRSNWVSLYKRHEHKERDKLEAEGKYRWEMKSSINSIFTLNNAVRSWGWGYMTLSPASTECDIRYMSVENWTQYTRQSSGKFEFI